MIAIKRTDSNNPDFIALVALLDQDLAIRDGMEHHFYAQFNKINLIKHAIVLYEDELPIGCGAIKEVANDAMEVKRMYTKPEYRGKGFATQVLLALETWTKEMHYTHCLLETGKRQPEAIALYLKNGYKQIPNYGQYAGVENSVCFEKKLVATDYTD